MTGADGSMWTTVLSADTPTYYAHNKEVEKSPNDDREYRFIKLTNGMEVILVHDPAADSAAASMDVGSGFLLDPDDKPGLAHFCEHLLFMGSELFPEENGFNEILARNNGFTNAVTFSMGTRFYFSVSADTLLETLPRFAAFFHCPLFSPSAVTREVNAVNAEYLGKRQDDDWRVAQLERHLSSDGHIWRKFGTGNTQTLLGPDAQEPTSAEAPVAVDSADDTAQTPCSEAGLELRRRVMDWWSTYYCANRMCLAILGKESLDDLSNVAAKLFSPVKNHALQPIVPIRGHPLGPEKCGTLISVATTLATYDLKVVFAVDIALSHTLESHPRRHGTIGLLQSFIHRRGPGSLHAYLKKKGWIAGLSTDTDGPTLSFDTMSVQIRLTEAGFNHHTDVVVAIFEYLSFLRSARFDSWHQEERCRISRLSFQFQEKQSPINLITWLSRCADWHRSTPLTREQFVKYSSVIDEWDNPDEENSYLHALLDGMTLKNGRVLISAPQEDHERLRGKLEWAEEPIYGTLYTVEAIDSDLLRRTLEAQAGDDFHLPTPNPFIPDDISIERVGCVTPAIHPDLVHKTKMSSLWFKKDDQFNVPQSFVKVKISSATQAERSHDKMAMSLLLNVLFNDALGETLYDASITGLTWSFDYEDLGGIVGLSGYSTTISSLLERILSTMRNFVVDAVRAETLRDELVRILKTFHLGDPDRTASGWLSYVTELYDMSEPMSKFVGALTAITPERLQDFIAEFYGLVSFRTLVTGSIDREKAVELEQLVERTVGATHPAVELTNKFMLLPEGKWINNVYRATIENPEEPTSVLNYYLQLGLVSQPRLIETALVLTRLLSEPAFDTLRTKEQLGYSVSCSAYNRFPIQGLNVIIRGERAPSYFEERVEAFFRTMLEKLRAMPEDDFVEHKDGTEKAITERATNLVAEGDRMWSDIEKGIAENCTGRIDLDILATISKQEVLDLFEMRVLPSPQRRKFSIHMWSESGRLVDGQTPEDLVRGVVEAFSVPEDMIAAVVKTIENANLDSKDHRAAVTEIFKDGGLSEEVVEAVLEGLFSQDRNDFRGVDSAKYGSEWDAANFVEDLCTFKNTLEVAGLPSENSDGSVADSPEI